MLFCMCKKVIFPIMENKENSISFEWLFLGALAKLWKASISYMSVCPSDRMEQLRSCSTYFD
jgi:hypothetical protein